MILKLLILRGLKIRGRGLASQKFEVFPVTGDLILPALRHKTLSAFFVSARILGSGLAFWHFFSQHAKPESKKGKKETSVCNY